MRLLIVFYPHFYKRRIPYQEVELVLNSSSSSVNTNVIIVTHVEVVYQGTADECLMILVHL